MSCLARASSLCLAIACFSSSATLAVPLDVGMDPAFHLQVQEDYRQEGPSRQALAEKSDINVWVSGDTVNTVCAKITVSLSSGGGTDCWGYEKNGNQYAIMGTFDGVEFVNPNTGQVYDVVPQASCGSSWRDMATVGDICYVVSECSGLNDGIMVIDMSFLPDSVHLVRTVTPLPGNTNQSSHNLTIDSVAGFLYTEGSASSFDHVRIHDISDPTNPIFVSRFGTGSTGSIHDLYAYNDTLYLAEGSNPFWSIWDMADKNNPQLIQRVAVPNPGYVHNVWPSDDRQLVVTTEETAGKTVKIWDISDLQNIQLVGQYLAGSGLAHNAHFLGNDTIVVSHYESGVIVLDVTNPASPSVVWSYDTYTSSESANFRGAWGAFPYTSDGRVYASNLDGRLFVLDDFTAILADSVAAPDTGIATDNQIRLDLDVTNSIEVSKIELPISYGGPFNLIYDSISATGLRTAYFDQIVLAGIDAFNKRLAINLNAGSQPALPPGSGPVVSVFFTVPASVSGDTNMIEFTPYSSFSTSFTNDCIGEITPVVSNGTLAIATCCVGFRGNIDGDPADEINISDLTYLVAYSFGGGPAPPCPEEANVNADPSQNIDISDLTALVAYMFGGGPQPASCNL